MTTTAPNPSPVRDYVVSLARTWVPIAWGAVLAWFVGRNLIDADTAAAAGDLGAGLATLVAALAAAVYYALVRLAEPFLMRIPVVGPIVVRLLIGSTQAPAYAVPAARHRGE